LTLALAGFLAASVGLMPARMAVAEQVLELPQNAARLASPDASVEDAAQPENPRPETIAAMPAGLGSVDDYESQDASSHSTTGAVSRPPTAPSERRSNHAALGNDLILGALVLGVLAIELRGAHQHR